jgi:hypothetical protein
MIRRTGPLFVVALMVALVLGGCGDDSVTPTDIEQSNTSGLIEGDISAADGNFEFTTDTNGDLDRPVPGPFIIRGKNIHYVDSLGVLSVDFTVEHRCRCAFPEPIGLTFIDLLPPGVTVENPDNDEHGPGAAIVFEFENDDGVWTAFEESLPRTVHFGVDAGVSIGFVARIDIGMEPNLGSIGGLVWHDANENGQIDRGEQGIGGVVINMFRTDGPEVSNAEILWRTLTGPDGSYRFDGLDAGPYEVHKILQPDLHPTTPTVIHVILVEEDGGVSDFLMANFGCVPVHPPGPAVEVGDFAGAWGDYTSRPEHLVLARGLSVIKCRNAPPKESVITPAAISTGQTDIDLCNTRLGALAGPVTDINRDARVLWLMGTPVHFDTVPTDSIPDDSTLATYIPGDTGPPSTKIIDFEDVEIGHNIMVFAWNFLDHRTLDGIIIRKLPDDTFAPQQVRVHGKVDEILMTPNGVIDAFIAMRTKIVITELTHIDIHD